MAKKKSVNTGKAGNVVQPLSAGPRAIVGKCSVAPGRDQANCKSMPASHLLSRWLYDITINDGEVPVIGFGWEPKLGKDLDRFWLQVEKGNVPAWVKAKQVTFTLN